MIRLVRSAVVLAGAVLLLSGCDGADPDPPAPTSGVATPATHASLSPARRVFDPVHVEDGVRRVLIESYLIHDLGEVSCPSGEDVLPGRIFECTVDIAGEKKKVTITVRDAEGGYEVSQPEP